MWSRATWILLVVLLVPRTVSAIPYTIALAPVGGVASFANAISSNGQFVAGYRLQDIPVWPFLQKEPFLWSLADGSVSYVELPYDPAQNRPTVVDVDNSGRVLFWQLATGGSNESWMWEQGQASQRLAIGASDVYARGLNEAGDVVGSVRLAPGAIVAFHGDLNGAWHTVPPLTGASYSNASAISDDGVILGHYHSGTIYPGYTYDTVTGQFTDLGPFGGYYTPAGGAPTQPVAINPANHMITNGRSLTGTSSRAYFWDGVLTDIGDLGGLNVLALDLNNADVVVGQSEFVVGNYDTHGFLWNASDGMRDLNALIDDDSWELISGSGVSETDAIAGVGLLDGWFRAFVLLPQVIVPEPSTAVLVCLGVALALRGFIRRRG